MSSGQFPPTDQKQKRIPPFQPRQEWFPTMIPSDPTLLQSDSRAYWMDATKSAAYPGACAGIGGLLLFILSSKSKA